VPCITDEGERRKWIAGQFLANREPKDLRAWWGEMADYASVGASEQKRIANAFLLSCLLDYRRRVQFDGPWEAVQICRELCPDDPWKLDGPIWDLGGKICAEKNPDCANCYLRRCCAFIQTNPA
jgi:hypothetical protein